MKFIYFKYLEKPDIDDVELLKHLKQMKNAPINDSSIQKEKREWVSDSKEYGMKKD